MNSSRSSSSSRPPPDYASSFPITNPLSRSNPSVEGDHHHLHHPTRNHPRGATQPTAAPMNAAPSRESSNNTRRLPTTSSTMSYLRVSGPAPSSTNSAHISSSSSNLSKNLKAGSSNTTQESTELRHNEEQLSSSSSPSPLVRRKDSGRPTSIHSHNHPNDDDNNDRRRHMDGDHDADAALLDDDMGTALLPPTPSRLSPPAAAALIRRRQLLFEFWRHPQATWTACLLFIRRMGDYLAYITLFIMLIVVPYVIYRALSNRQLDLAAFRSAGIMVLGTVILSIRLIYLHLTHWYMPDVQKHVVRILVMVPLYATQSYLSLIFHRARIYIDTLRDFYEAFVIASFVYYLIELLGGQDALVNILQNKPPDSRLGHHTFPLNCWMPPWELGLEFMLQCKHGVLQYVVFKTLATVLTLLLQSAGVYQEGKFHWSAAYPYMCFIQNVSVMYALYCLVMLYSAVYDELRHPINWKPLGKFLCVKGVIFFTWWQGIVIFYLRDHGIIEDMGPSWSSEDVANGLIDYCIVFEMVGFAIAHSYTFTYKEYLPSRLPIPPPSMLQSHNSSATTPTTMAPTGSGYQPLLPSPDTADALITDVEQNQHNSEDCAHNQPIAVDNESCVLSACPGADQQQQPAPIRPTYRPPAVLERPMNFREAFWSSTMLPKETYMDIQSMRTGVDAALQEARRPRALSMQEINSTTESEVEEHNQEQEENDDLTRTLSH